MIAEAEIHNMSAKDRRELYTLLRESTDELLDEDFESPAWHEAVLAERRRKLEAGESKRFTLEECRAMYAGMKARESSCSR